jgi:hypothetical protein
LKVPTPVFLLVVAALVWPALGTGHARLARLAVVVLPGLAAAVWWTLASNAYFVPYRNTIFIAAQQAHIDQAAQEHYLLTHLYNVPALLWNTATAGQLFRLGGMTTAIGQDGGAGPLPEWVAFGWLALVAVLAVGTHEGARVRRSLRAWVAGSGVLFGLGVAIGIYLTWTAVGASKINGIHGRYSTPALLLLVPLLVGLGGTRVRIGRQAVAIIVMAVTAALMVAVFVRTAQYYYHQAPWQVVPRVVSAVF